MPRIKSIPELAFEALITEIREFEATLTDQQELAIMAGPGGQMLYVSSIADGGQVIVFSGVDEQGRASRLLTHYTQISVQLVAAQKVNPTARRIGF